MQMNADDYIRVIDTALDHLALLCAGFFVMLYIVGRFFGGGGDAE